MFEFMKEIFIGLLGACKTESFSQLLASNLKRRMKCVSLNNYVKVDQQSFNINSNKPPIIHLLSVIINAV